MVWWLNFFPGAVGRAKLVCSSHAPVVELGRRFRVLSWNIQFGGSRKYHFFYDGGDAVSVSCGDVRDTTEAIRRRIASHRPDLLLLQEVDRDSARTCRIDELSALSKGKEPWWTCRASTWYHRSRFVPAPLWSPMGRVRMDLVVASRFHMARARRRALPQLRESFLRRAFNLKRAILEVELPVAGSDKPLVILNTHLSAFSKGDGTLGRQVDRILARLDELDRKGTWWILAGDFNMLPPGDDPKRLGPKEASLYADEHNPIEKLFAKYGSALDLDAYRVDPSRFFTYLPHGATKTDRVLDYVFVGKGVEVLSFEPDHVQPLLSDHVPLVLDVRLTDEAAAR